MCQLCVVVRGMVVIVRMAAVMTMVMVMTMIVVVRMCVVMVVVVRMWVIMVLVVRMWVVMVMTMVGYGRVIVLVNRSVTVEVVVVVRQRVIRSEHKGFDDHRHRLHVLDFGTDVDVVEVRETQLVHGHDRRPGQCLVGQDAPHHAANVSVQGEHDGLCSA